MSLLQMLVLFHNWVLRERKIWGGGRLSEVPWLTVGLVVGHQSIRSRVLVISRLVLLTPGLLVPELQTHGFGFFNNSLHVLFRNITGRSEIPLNTRKNASTPQTEELASGENSAALWQKRELQHQCHPAAFQN